MDTALPFAFSGAIRAGQPPRIRQRPDLGVPGPRPSRWVTRARPKVERIACPWLIRRFIDPQAEFFFAPRGNVLEEAKRLGAVPFDIPGVEISHHWEQCSFDALLHAFDLDHPALVKMAAIVRGADTDRLSIAPQASGLLAISLGLSRLCDDDHDMLEKGMVIYDCLFAWANAQEERHGWHLHE